MNRKIIILDYTTGNVYISNYDENVYGDDFELFLEDYNNEHKLELKHNNCYYMTTEKMIMVKFL